MILITAHVDLSKNVGVYTVEMPRSVPWLETAGISVHLCNFVIEVRVQTAMEFSLI